MGCKYYIGTHVQANQFAAKKNIGYDPMTFSSSHYRNPNKSMIQVVLKSLTKEKEVKDY